MWKFTNTATFIIGCSVVQHILYQGIHSANLDKSLKKWDFASYSVKVSCPDLPLLTAQGQVLRVALKALSCDQVVEKFSIDIAKHSCAKKIGFLYKFTELKLFSLVSTEKVTKNYS